jgi:hypothetical protein
MGSFEVAMDVERKLEEFEKRRKHGMRLVATGVWPAELTFPHIGGMISG